MKLTELFAKDQINLSFEVFPNKKPENLESVKAKTAKIAELKPAFMSVTYGAGGGTSQFTLEIAKNIQDNCGVPVLAHLTGVSSTKEIVAQRIEELQAAGIQNIMALRGDLTPEMEGQDRTNWAYKYAIDLIRELKEKGDFCIGSGCYPEVHPEAANMLEDIRFLKEKVDAGCDFLTSQLFFDNSIFYDYLYKVREAGIAVPVIPGIMPVTNAKQMERSIQMSGSFIPRHFKALLERFGNNDAAMKQAGIAYATEQIIDLYANGVKNVHVYTMNNPEVAEKIMANVKDLLG
ncbi:MAG: methylenetetrahydrofolate reductase [Anaerotignum sp.]|nr:methylenetetrahydrofolate reductase [NAD(P)H] [Anaerotignum sp.]MBR5793470.1 methylenetetrahydrofolate reductase [NAD(P)H] [Anaerotignum sp.]